MICEDFEKRLLLGQLHMFVHDLVMSMVVKNLIASPVILG